MHLLHNRIHMNRHKIVCLPLFACVVFVLFTTTFASPIAQSADLPHTDLKNRVCGRISRRFSDNLAMIIRINNRLEKRFGFICSTDDLIDMGKSQTIKTLEQEAIEQKAHATYNKVGAELVSAPGKSIYDIQTHESTGDEYIRGNPDSPVQLILFLNLESKITWEAYDALQLFLEKEKNASLRLAYYDFGTIFLANGKAYANAPECAGSMKGNIAYWTFLDTMRDQVKLVQSSFAVYDFYSIVDQMKLNQGGFQNCYSSQKYISKVTKGTKELNETWKTIDQTNDKGLPTLIIKNSRTGNLRHIKGWHIGYENLVKEKVKEIQ